MMDLDPELQALTIRLSEAAARNTASAIGDRLQTIRSTRKAEEKVNELEELVSTLLADKNELVQIATSYDEQLVAQRISDDDIEYIVTELLPLLTHLAEAADDQEKAEEVQKFLDLIQPIISVQTMRILQLLGFNFRRAIGEPLTELICFLISSRTDHDPDLAQEQILADTRREAALFQILQDPDAYARFEAFRASR